MRLGKARRGEDHRSVGRRFFRYLKHLPDLGACGGCQQLGAAQGVCDRILACVVLQRFGFRYLECQTLNLIGAGAHQIIEHRSEISKIANDHDDLIADAVASERRRLSVLGVIHHRLDIERRRLNVLRVDAFGFKRRNDFVHRLAVGGQCVARGWGFGRDAGGDARLIGLGLGRSRR